MAYPPTKKKMGITWKIHVSHAEYGLHSRLFIKVISPLARSQIDAASQCPKTTTRIAKARQKSMTRFLVAGVDSAISLV